jgi:Type II secretion system (T2SS), protein E, N-terminal domain
LKTLAEIAIEAGLVTKAGAAKAGRLSEERKLPLVVILIRDLGVDELSLIAALRKQTRVPLLDPAQVQVDPEALRLVPRDSCARLRVLPIGVNDDGKIRVLRVAMADPTDTSAILELEVIANCEIEVTALPLSAIEELVDKGYKQFSTAVTRSRPYGDNLSVSSKRPSFAADGDYSASEVSVTAQIPLALLIPPGADLEARFVALCGLLVTKGIVTDAELAEALKKSDGKPSDS